MKISKRKGKKKLTKQQFLKENKCEKYNQSFFTSNAYDLNRVGSFVGGKK